MNWKTPENNDNFEGDKKPWEVPELSDAEKAKIGKERLENKIHEELNSLKDSLNKAHAHETLDSADWLGRNTGGGKGAKKEPSGMDAIFEKPVDAHVVYTSDILGYDSLRSAVLLGKDIAVDTTRLILHPVREIRNTLDIWWNV